MIGKLRERVTIEQPTRASDGQGGYTETWSTLATVWAAIKPVTARETYFGHKLEHRVTHKITIRYRSDIAIQMRIAQGTRYFQIHGYKNVDERNRFLELLCEEGAPS